MIQVSKHFFKITCFLGSILLLVACKDEAGCGSTNDASLELHFFKKSDPLADTTVVFDSVFAIGSDSIYYNITDTLSSFILPINPHADMTQFIFKSTLVNENSETKIIDSLLLTYTKKQRIISIDCGSEQFYEQLQAQSHTFDSLVLENDKLNDELNISIYK